MAKIENVNVTCNAEGILSGTVELGPKTFRTQDEVNSNVDGKAVHEIDLTGVSLKEVALDAAKQKATEHTNSFRQHSRGDTSTDVDEDREKEAQAYRDQFPTDDEGNYIVRYHWEHAGTIDAPVTAEQAQDNLVKMLASMDPAEREVMADNLGIDLEQLGL